MQVRRRKKSSSVAISGTWVVERMCIEDDIVSTGVTVEPLLQPPREAHKIVSSNRDVQHESRIFPLPCNEKKSIDAAFGCQETLEGCVHVLYSSLKHQALCAEKKHSEELDILRKKLMIKDTESKLRVNDQLSTNKFSVSRVSDVFLSEDKCDTSAATAYRVTNWFGNEAEENLSATSFQWINDWIMEQKNDPEWNPGED